ncbi:MAG: Spx/MgsR family RNA polymerase-binding regulatory protein [Ferruginibacter sp.]|nr:Spx/MgsR family RNA polymerase-binding regulatory protein [Ferruginibacter sp.]
MTLYGIPNCDTTKKAISFLKENKTTFSFHNYKEEGITKEKLKEWIDKVGVESIFNKRSTTWKELSEKEKQKTETTEGAMEIMINYNSIIKRPIIELQNKIIVGFNINEFKTHLNI